MRLTRIVLLVLIAGVVLITASCDDSRTYVNGLDPLPTFVRGNGSVTEKTIAVIGCSRLRHDGIGNVYVRLGGAEELTIRAEENLIEYLKADLQGSELVIWKENVSLKNTRPIEFHLTVANLGSVALTGAGEIHGLHLDTGPMSSRLTGVGTIEFVNLTAPSLAVMNSGLGDIVASGIVQSQTITLRNMGQYKGRNLESEEADVTIAGTGSATVRVQNHLTARVQGSGNVYYIGDPIVTSSISGSGDVVQLGE